VLVLDESVLLGLFAGGDVVVPSPLVPGVLADPLDDWSGMLGAAGIVLPVGLVESPTGGPDCIPGAWPAADEPVSGLVAVCARAATDETSTPAAKNGASLLLMVIDASPVV
jgi:hypothetical protein